MNKMIPSFTSLENATGEDIFYHFRSYFKTPDLHAEGIITVKASSTIPGPGNNRAEVSIIIHEPDNKRWVSEVKPNQFFTINFYSNFVSLVSYKIETSKSMRYITNWDVYGISNNKLFLIDRRVNESICNSVSIWCSNNINMSFTCQHPGVFSKFLIQSTGPDSVNEDCLSLTKIRFYGVVSPLRELISCKNGENMYGFSHSLFLFALLIK